MRLHLFSILYIDNLAFRCLGVCRDLQFQDCNVPLRFPVDARSELNQARTCGAQPRTQRPIREFHFSHFPGTEAPVAQRNFRNEGRVTDVMFCFRALLVMIRLAGKDLGRQTLELEPPI
jgi:hypothetical protein